MKKKKMSKAAAIAVATIYPIVSANIPAYATELSGNNLHNNKIVNKEENQKQNNVENKDNVQIHKDLKKESTTSRNSEKKIENNSNSLNLENGLNKKNDIVTPNKNKDTVVNENTDTKTSVADTKNNVTNKKPSIPVTKAKVADTKLAVSDSDFSKNEIVFNNVWNQYLGTLKMNIKNHTFNFTGGWAEINPYLTGEAFSLELYSKDGTLLKEVQVNGSEHPENDMANVFNGTKYQVGDFLKIDYKTSTNISITNFNGQASENVKNIILKLTDTGVLEHKVSIKAEPLEVLSPNKVTKGTVVGEANPNNKIIVSVNGEKFVGESDNAGKFSVNVTDSLGFNKNTKVTVMQEGGLPIPVTLAIAKGLTLNKDSIVINNVWSQYIGTIGFNPLTETISFNKGYSGTNPYLAANGEAFGVYLYNADGSLINYEKVFGSSYPENSLNTLLNGTKFKFGDYIRIDYITSANIQANINGKNVNIKKDTVFKITEGGLQEASIKPVSVNPFGILGFSNDAPTKGTITGNTLAPFENVEVKVLNKVFKGKSNENGQFSINLEDNKGFTKNTIIDVSAPGNLTKVISPVVGNVEIENSFIGISNSLYPTAYWQKVSFNPSTMKVSNTGDEFIAQVLSGDSGKILGSTSGGNFLKLSNLNKLNGTSFKFGDVVSVIESEQTNLTVGYMRLGNKNGVTNFSTVNKFTNFKITPNGLIKMENKDLTVNPILYKGENTVTVSGKTLGNSNLTVRYGNITKTIKSDESGNFSYNVPVNEAPVGSEVSVYLNNNNMVNTLVQYDTKVVSVGENKIEIYNQDGFNVFNIGFNPINDELNAQKVYLDKTYAGLFYGNHLRVSVLSKDTGKVLESYTGEKPGEIDAFVKALNNKPYEKDGIIEVSYNPNYIQAKVMNGKESIGNVTGENEYFRITNKGLINVTNKFINVEPFNVLSGGKVTSGVIKGKVAKNENVDVTVDGKTFKGKASDTGEFAIEITDANGFNVGTNIEVSANGYMVTNVNPTMAKGNTIDNSFINFYKNNFETSKIVSSITFDPIGEKFVVNNYENSFGNGSEDYFTLGYYNKLGTEIWTKEFNNGSTEALSNFLNNKEFSYGDVISLKYNDNLPRPVVLSNLNAISNVYGTVQYFRITKNGLESISYGTKSKANSVTLNDGILNIKANTDFSLGTLEGKNVEVLLKDKNGNKIGETKATVTGNNSLGANVDLDKDSLKQNVAYDFYVLINGKEEPLYINSTLPTSSKYNFGANANNVLEVSLNNFKVNVENGNSIETLQNTLNEGIVNSKESISNLINNENSSNNLITLEFINTIGKQNLINFVEKNNENKDFTTWMLNNNTAMKYFLEGYQTGKPVDALQILENIWSTYGNSRAGFNLKMAVATALANTNTTPSAWPNYGPVGSPVERYNIFEGLNAENGMLPVFRTLNVRLLEMVVGTPLPNNQIMLARRIILQNHNGLINDTLRGLNNIAYTIGYNYRNPHNGINVFAPGYYPKNPTIASVWYNGGVCGATAQMGAVGPNVFGVPSKYVYQPGHVVFLYYLGKQNAWQLGNDVFGWAKTDGPEISGWSDKIANSQYVGSYDRLYAKAISKDLNKSNQYLMLTNLNIGNTKKLEAIKEAINIDPYNLGAWLEKIKIMNNNPSYTADDYINLANEIMSTFKNYPMPMFDTILQIKDKILQLGTKSEYNTFVTNLKNTLENNKTQPQVKETMIGLMPQYGLVLNKSKNLGEITISSWTSSKTVQMIFTKDGLNVLGQAFWLGSNNNTALKINFYSKNGALLSSNSYTGETDGGNGGSNTPQDTLNGNGYSMGEIVTIYYTPGAQANGKVHATNIEGNTITVPNESQYQITSKGLVPLGKTYENNGIKFTFKDGNMTPLNMNYGLLKICYPNGTPITNQYVEINGEKEKTDSLGEIKIENIKKGGENICISKKGYIDYKLHLSDGQVAQAELVYSIVPIMFNVTLPNGKPLENGSIIINGATYNTNAKGQVLFETLPGTHIFTIQEKGYSNQEFTLNVNVGAGMMKEDIKLFKNSYKIWGTGNETVQFGQAFNKMKGVSVYNVPQKDIIVSGDVNVNKPGEYTLLYKVEYDGKIGTAKRIITVNDNYNVKIEGANNETIAYGSNFNPLKGVKVIDPAEDGNPTLIVVSNDVNTKKAGIYKVVYKAIDSYGVTSTITRDIKVSKENVKIETNGFNNKTIDFGSKFNPLEGVDAKSSNGEKTSIKVTSGNVNTEKPGKYILKYEITNGTESVNKERVITVNSNYKFTINGAENKTISFDSSFNPMEGVNVYDPAEGADVKVRVIGSVNIKKPGKYMIYYDVSDVYGKTDKISRIITVNDNYSLTPIGFTNETIDFNSKFNPLKGLSVKDPAIGEKTKIEVISGKVNTRKPGNYKVKYLITDSNGKSLEETRTITVNNNYNLNINAPKTETINFGESFNPLSKIVVIDEAEDGNPKVELISGDVNSKRPGKYILKYRVKDAYGKVRLFSREVIVKNNYKIKLEGITNEKVSFGTKFDSMTGVKAIDEAIDSNVKITVLGEVNTSAPGVYKLTYIAKDAYGVEAKESREITVENNYGIKAEGLGNTSVNFGEEFNPLKGIVVIDKADKNPEITLVSGKVNTEKPGKYTLIYKITDCYGKDVRVVREVTVKPTYKIIIEGATDEKVAFGSKFNNMLGIKVIDKALDNDVKIQVKGNVDTEKPGIYKLTYTATDIYGVKATITREIEVKDEAKHKVTPDKKGESGNKVAPDTKGESGNKVAPDTKGESGNKVAPDTKGESGNKVAPDKKGESGNKVAPDKKGESGNKVAPDTKGESGNKVAPDKKGESGNKVAPDKKGESGNKVAPDTKGESGNKVAPDTKGESGNKVAPDKKGESGNKVAPDKKGESGNKVATDTKGESGNKVASDTKGESGNKVAPDTKGESGNKVAPDTKGESGNKVAPDTKGESGNKVAPDTKGESGNKVTPDINGESGNNVTQGQRSEVENNETPVQSIEPNVQNIEVIGENEPSLTGITNQANETDMSNNSGLATGLINVRYKNEPFANKEITYVINNGEVNKTTTDKDGNAKISIKGKNNEKLHVVVKEGKNESKPINGVVENGNIKFENSNKDLDLEIAGGVAVAVLLGAGGIFALIARKKRKKDKE